MTPPTAYCSSTPWILKTPATTGGNYQVGPGGDEDLIAAARREVTEESGIILPDLNRKRWVRESR